MVFKIADFDGRTDLVPSGAQGTQAIVTATGRKLQSCKNATRLTINVTGSIVVIVVTRADQETKLQHGVVDCNGH